MLTTLLCACGDKYVSQYNENYVYDGVSLVGKWREGEHSDEYYQVYDFENDKVTLTAYSYGIMMQEITADYSVEGNNTLVISWGNGYTDKNKFSITGAPVVVITQVADSQTNEMELVPYDLDWCKDNSRLVGTWVNNDNANETFTFNSNYTLYVEGEFDSYTMNYATKGDTLAIGVEIVNNFKEDVNILTYKVEGDALTLTGVDKDKNEIAISFTREK